MFFIFIFSVFYTPQDLLLLTCVHLNSPTYIRLSLEFFPSAVSLLTGVVFLLPEEYTSFLPEDLLVADSLFLPVVSLLRLHS